MREIRRFPEPVQAIEECGLQILRWLTQAMDENENGIATLAVSGGSSPKAMFEYFATLPYSWSQVHLFWVDERGVPPTDAQSNFKLAKDAWLDPTKFPETNIHRIRGELPALEAAEEYTAAIRYFFNLAPGQVPAFDVIHRGMGSDAHTASLFPGDPAIEDQRGIASAVWVEKFSQWRITLLPRVLEAAHHTAMLVQGADKAPALEHVWSDQYDPMRYPAQIATRDGCPAVWFTDYAAAGPKSPR